MVALFHFQLFLGVAPNHGYLAVDLFFGISGFVLSAAYCERFRTGMTLQAFFDLRVARFYPLYLVGFAFGLSMLAAGLLPSALGSWEVGTGILLGLFMMPNPGSFQLFPLNGVSWSLFCELLINAVLARWLWKFRSRHLAAFATAGLIAIIWMAGYPYYLNMGWNWANAIGGLARTIFSFSLGMLLYRVAGGRPRHVHPLAAFIPLTALLFAISPIGSPAIWDLAMVSVVCPSILVAATLSEAPAWAQPTMRWSGGMSYALYAIHWPLAVLIGRPLKSLPFGIAAMLYLAAAVALAHLLERYLDRPLQSYFKRRRGPSPKVNWTGSEASQTK